MSESENSPKLEILDTLNKTLEDGRISFFKNPKEQILLKLDSFFDRDYQGQELFNSFGRKNFETLPENSTFQECLDVLEYAPAMICDWIKKQKDTSKTINSETVNINKTGVSINNEQHPFPEVKDLINLQIFIINGILFGLKCNELGEITIEGITPCSFDKVYGFNGELAVVGYKSNEFFQFSEQYGLINSKGEILIDRCEGLFNFVDNLILVHKGYSYLVYNKDGQQVKSKYDEIGSLNRNFYYGKIGGSFDVINSSGKIIDNKKCDGDGQCKYDFPHAKSMAVPKAIIEEPYSDKYDSVGEFSQGFAIVKKDGKYSFINEQEKQIADFRYDSVENFKNGLALVSVGKPPNFGIFYGYIDTNGKEIIPCRYTDANNFKNDLALVTKNNKIMLINIRGEEINLENFDSVSDFQSGLAIVRSNNKYGLINTKGEIVLPCKYTKIQNFVNGLARIETNGRKGFLSTEGCLMWFSNKCITSEKINLKPSIKDSLSSVRKLL